MLNIFKTRFLIQVNYNSGISVKFWAYEFNYEKAPSTGVTFSWQSVNHTRPILLNADGVESVWQIKTRRFGII